MLCGADAAGILSGTRRLDVFHHIRFEDEANFAGGVFVIVRCKLESIGLNLEAGNRRALVFGARLIVVARPLAQTNASCFHSIRHHRRTVSRWPDNLDSSGSSCQQSA